MALLVGFVATAQSKMELKDNNISLGTIQMTDTALHSATFRFTNVGNKPLVIVRVKTSCGCTVAQFSKEPIRPGAEGTIEVTYDHRNRPLGSFLKTINVYTNDSTRLYRLFISGETVDH